MDLGFARAGFDIRIAVEIDPSCCETLTHNWPELESRIIQEPLEEVSTRRILRRAGLKVGEAGIVFGGSPCQSWCLAGNRLGLRDPRGQSLLDFCRVVREAQPATFCLENVPGLLNHSETEVLSLILEEVNRGRRKKYSVSVDILNAAEFGVPQLRRRAFIVGWHGSGEFYFPAPSHGVDGVRYRSNLAPAITVGRALAGMPEPSPPSAIAHRVAKTIPNRNRKWYKKV